MAKRNEDKSVVEKDPAEPIGNPPGGGCWTWDIPSQMWVEVVSEAQSATE